MKDSKQTSQITTIKKPSLIKSMIIGGTMAVLGALYTGCTFDKSGVPYDGNTNNNNNNVTMVDAGDAGNNDAGDASTDAGDSSIDAGVLPDPTSECPNTCFVEQEIPIAATGNTLTLNEKLGDVQGTYEVFDATVLGITTLTTAQGSTLVNQSLKFAWDTDTTADVAPVYAQDNTGVVSDFLKATDGQPLFRTELEFAAGLKSHVNAANRLEDLVGKELRILGQRFAVTDSYIDAQNRLNLELLGDYTKVSMPEGTTFDFSCGSDIYSISAGTVDAANEVQLTVNGEVTNPLGLGEYETLFTSQTIAVTDIASHDNGKMVIMYLGEKLLQLQDATLAETDGNVKMNSELLEDSEVNIDWHENANVVTIDGIVLTTNTDGLLGDAPHVGIGQSISTYLDEPEGMISDKWNLSYGGLTQPASEVISFQASGTDELRMTFTNTQDIEYSNIRLAFVNGTGLFYGDDDDNLVFQQGNTQFDPTVQSIGPNDYFVLSKNGTLPTGVTRVLRFNGLSGGSLSFTDMGTGSTINASVNTPIPGCSGGYNTASISSGGNSFAVRACNNSLGPALNVDLDGDGVMGGKSYIVVKGGGIIDLGYQTDNPDRQPIPGNTLDMYLMTDASQTVDSTMPESVQMQVTGDTTTSTIDIAVADQPFNGLVMYTDSTNNQEQGMTNYGVLFSKDTLTQGSMTIDYPESQRLPLVYLLFDTECNE